MAPCPTSLDDEVLSFDPAQLMQMSPELGEAARRASRRPRSDEAESHDLLRWLSCLREWRGKHGDCKCRAQREGDQSKASSHRITSSPLSSPGSGTMIIVRPRLFVVCKL